MANTSYKLLLDFIIHLTSPKMYKAYLSNLNLRFYTNHVNTMFFKD